MLVGGGLGVAPVFPQLREYKRLGNRTISIIGFRTRDLVFWEQPFRAFSDRLEITTDDGSYGRKGFVTAALADVLAQEKDACEVVAIGPIPMMRACCEVTRPLGIPTIVSLNSIMVDGTGMCGSCRVTVGGAMKFACVDGADFDGHLVNFDELSLRQKRFEREEKAGPGALPRRERAHGGHEPARLERRARGRVMPCPLPELPAAEPEPPGPRLPKNIRTISAGARAHAREQPRRGARPQFQGGRRWGWTWKARWPKPTAACAARSRAAFRAVRWPSTFQDSSPRWRAAISANPTAF